VIALNFSMEVGSQTQSVTVEAGAPLIQQTPREEVTSCRAQVREPAL
jgi:hypothetical protein